MTNLSTLKRFALATAMAAAFVFVSGTLTEINAQRDPFAKPGYMRPKKQTSTSPSSKTASTGPVVPVNYGPPPIEARIEYYKRLRDAANAEGVQPPKVTSVLTLGEMAVTGIFKTPRGYAAMVEATPINLSYTIYPGEKFFDGQLVAVEENRLVFRKVTKVGEGKFVASVENKPLKTYSTKAQVEGTAPASATSDKPVQTASSGQPASSETQKPTANPFLSPLDEMNRLPAEPQKETPKKGAKKPTKVAKNDGN